MEQIAYVIVNTQSDKDSLNIKKNITAPCNNEGRKEGNVLLNDALSTFYLPLYGVW